MKKFEIAKELIGSTVIKEDLKHVDCYVWEKLGIFIPATGPCGYAEKEYHTHPAYMITVFFEENDGNVSHYEAEITSPEVPHCDEADRHYYCLLIEKEYFEKRYLMYGEQIPAFQKETFQICTDILKALNTFMFECSKEMKNSDITLRAQAEIITHWIIRSLFGESLDMRAVSPDYSVARAQHYMEQHYMENITVARLASLGYISESNFSRRFKKETRVSPIEYLIEIRLNRAKLMLRRSNISMTEIAMQCGFNSSTHFSSCFLNKQGITPTEYRKKYAEY